MPRASCCGTINCIPHTRQDVCRPLLSICACLSGGRIWNSHQNSGKVDLQHGGSLQDRNSKVVLCSRPSARVGSSAFNVGYHTLCLNHDLPTTRQIPSAKLELGHRLLLTQLTVNTASISNATCRPWSTLAALAVNHIVRYCTSTIKGLWWTDDIRLIRPIARRCARCHAFTVCRC